MVKAFFTTRLGRHLGAGKNPGVWGRAPSKNRRSHPSIIIKSEPAAPLMKPLEAKAAIYKYGNITILKNRKALTI